MANFLFKSSGERGHWGEAEAAKYLREKGYVLLASNYKTRFGELDIVAEKNGIVVVVEVKTRSAYDFARGLEAVSPSKIRKMKSATLSFIASRNDDRPVRFDVIEILAGEYRDDPPREIIHHENVYMDMG